MTKRGFQQIGLALMFAVAALGIGAEAQTRPAATQTRPAAAGQKAGTITALLPVAKITRGLGRSAAVLEAKKGDPVIQNDLVRTEKGGRARITLEDQSILSLGSQAELRIQSHNARSQQTALQLQYGRIRAEVASITRDGGRFELRTPTAVAGVIGTDFGVDSRVPGVTGFLCISGIVQIRGTRDSSNSLVACPAGSYVSVPEGMAPTPPRPATKQEVQEMIQDTEPAVIQSLSPASALPGATLRVDVSGSKLSGIQSVNVATVSTPAPTGSATGGAGRGPMVNGVTASLSEKDATDPDKKLGIEVSISKDATPGVRTFTFTKPDGQSAAAVFVVLAPPDSRGAFNPTDVQKAYFTILEDQRLGAIASINAVGISIQQRAADAEQVVRDYNDQLDPRLNISRLPQDLLENVQPLLTAMTGAGNQVNEETGRAGGTLVQEINRLAGLTISDAEKFQQAQAFFDRVNPRLLERYDEILKSLLTPTVTASENIVKTMDRWMEQLRAQGGKLRPLPRLNTDDVSVDLGAVTQFDASRSTPAPGSAILGYKWMLCDPSYQPAQVGVPLPANDTRCRPLGDYVSSTPDFKVETCMLKPQVYVARLVVQDANGQAVAMDARMRVLPPQYEPPGMRLRSLTDAYQQLQPNIFLSFFDEGFSGLTELQETIRKTFTVLASMNINLRVSQAAIGCNEATVRADWEQAYTFKDDQTCVGLPLGSICQRVVFKQEEQLTVRMKRVPGKNWFITEFQGDNGTVQGTPPGPVQRDQSLPDLRIGSLNPVSTPAAAKEDSAIGIAPGTNSFAAVVENIGTADLLTSVRVRFEARDGNGNTLAFDVREIGPPLAVGGSTTVIGQLNIPDLGPGVKARVFAAVNPGCQVPEQNCDATNVTLLNIIIGIVDLRVTGFTPVGNVIATRPAGMVVQVTNIGSRSSNPSAGNLRVLFGTTVAGTGNLPSIAPGATANVPLAFTAPNLTGTQPLVIDISPPSPGEINPANDAFSGSLAITPAIVDLKVISMVPAVAPPYLGGQSVNFQLNVANVGNVASSANSYTCSVTGPAGTFPVGSGAVPVLAAAGGIGIPVVLVVPANMAPSADLTCSVGQDPLESAANLTDNTRTQAFTVNPNIDLEVISVTGPALGQMGATATITVQVRNNGTDTAAAGWSLGVRINGSPVMTPVIIGTTLAGGATMTETPTVTLPQIGTPPTNNTSYSLQAVANANAAVPETVTANNVFTGSINLVDFVLLPASAGGNAVIGRALNYVPAVGVQPSTYALPLTINYTNLPPGVTPSGSPFGQDLTGTPTSQGTFTFGANATVSGVTRTRPATQTINVVPEISITQGTAFPGLTSGGSPQTLQVNVTGGIYPVAVGMPLLPTGVTTSSPNPAILTAPGSVTFSLSASLAATPGAITLQVKGTDGGDSNTGTAPGNIILSVPTAINGQANYIISSVTLAAPHTNGSGADAFQVGENIQIDFAVQNAGNLTQAGTINVNFTSGCGGGSTSVAAPAAGAAVTGAITLPISCATGAYNLGVAISTTLPETTTGDNTAGPFPFEVFDFQLFNLLDVGTVNVPLAGFSNLVFSHSQSGPSAPLSLAFTASGVGGKAQVSAPATVTPGNIPYTVTAAAGTVSGDTDTISGQITRFGVTKTTTETVRFYTASIDNITSGQPGATSGNPLLLPINGASQSVDFKLVGTFGGSATFVTPTATGFNINLVSATPSLPNDVFTLDFAALTGASTTVLPVTIAFGIPDTFPAQQVTTTLWVKAFAVPDIEVTSVVGTGARFAGRDFSQFPVLDGEGGDLSITISNTGAGPSTAGLPLEVYLWGLYNVNTVPVSVPSIPAGSSITLTVHVRTPDGVPQGSTSFEAFVGSDPLETNTGNNSNTLAVNTSSWTLELNGNGDGFSPLSVPVPTPGNASTQLRIFVTDGVGDVFVPISTVQGAVSSFMTAVMPSALDHNFQNVTISASTSPQAPSGEYTVQVIAKMMDGATVTATRAKTLHIQVNSGTPVDTVTVTSSVSNHLAGAPSTCSGPCTPLQIDGLLVESLTLTATRSGGSSGATDLIFADDGSTVISNVSTSGAPLVQQLTAVPYGTPMQVNFAADENTTGVLNDGPGYTVVAATAVTTAQRGAPPLDPVGTQHTTLYFNIGDIDINLNCIELPAGASVPVSIPVLALSGFSKPITWQWQSTGGLNVTVASPTGGGSPPYANISSTFTNNETADIFAQVTFVLTITISNGNGSATKFFPVHVYPFTGGCTFGAGKGSAAALDLPGGQKGYWKRNASGAAMAAARSVSRVQAVAAGTPDLQIKPVDVSISPSIPKPGDTLDVRFKVTNLGDGAASDVPVALVVNGKAVATETYSLKPGASSLGGFQYALPADEQDVTPARFRPVNAARDEDMAERPMGRSRGINVQLAVDPAGTVKQKSATNKMVALTKGGLWTPADGAPPAAAERVYLEMNTICAGFRMTSGAVVDCQGGADLDIAIEDLKSGRFTLNAAIGIADLGQVEPAHADARGASFSANAVLVLGHTYAVQLTGGKVGYVKFANSLTPRQLAAEAKRRFGLNGVRILRKLGGDTGSTGAGDTAGRVSADALMYLDMTFRP